MAEADRRLAERERFVSFGRLSSSLAHEINNPLGGLLNAVDTVQKYADRPEVVRKSADLLKRGLGHMRDVARATLDLNRLDHAGVVLAAEDFQDLKLLIEPEISRQMQRLGCPKPASSLKYLAQRSGKRCKSSGFLARSSKRLGGVFLGRSDGMHPPNTG